MGEDEPLYAGRAGRLSCIGRRRMSHGVRLLRRALRTVGVVDEEIRPPAFSAISRVGLVSMEKVATAPGWAMRKPTHSRPWSSEKGVTSVSPTRVGFPGISSLQPRRSPPSPLRREGQVEEVPQRTERVGRGVNDERGLREGRQGGEQGREPADVVEVAVAQEQVAHVLQRDPGRRGDRAARCRWRCLSTSSPHQRAVEPG